MTDIFISARRGAGAPAEILYGTVTFKPTLAHSRSTSIVLPAPTTFDLVNGEVVATNVQPTPEPVEGKIEWAYEVTFKDRHSKTYSFLVGVPDSTTQVNFTSLPRYFETQPPLFGEGPKGEPGEAATVAVGTVTSGSTAQVTNSGTNTDAVLDFVLPKGDKGDTGDGVNILSNKAFADAPSTYPTGVSQSYISSSSLGWPYLNSLIVTDKRITGRTVQTITRMDDNVEMRRTEIAGDAWSPFKEIANASLATTTAAGLMSSADKIKLNDVGVIQANTKLPADLSSTYPEGVTVTNVRVSDGWPAVRGSHPSFTRITTERSKGLTPAIQRASAYVSTPPAGGNLNDNDILYRVSQADGTWGSWQTSLSKALADTLYASKNIEDHSPSISVRQQTYGTNKCNIITIHAGGERRPGLVHKYLDGLNTSVTPTEAKEHYIDTVIADIGGTIVNNASGLIHIAGVTPGDGARVRLRGAQVVDGVAVNPFPSDTHWTCHEAVGIMADGELRGFSSRRGDTVESMVSAGVQNSFTFGPIIVEGGMVRDLSDPFWADAVTIVSSLNFIGQKANGDIVLVNSPGKSGTSGGTLADQAAIALDLGLEFAFSLDRGGSGQCWAGAAPLCASSDAGGRRLIADYLYTTAPIGSPVISQDIPLVLASTVKAVPGYEPTVSISKDGNVRLKGRINRSDDLNFGSEITTVALMPPFAQTSTNISGMVTGSGDAIRRWLQNGNDGYLRILGATTAAPATTYLDLSLVQWQIG